MESGPKVVERSIGKVEMPYIIKTTTRSYAPSGPATYTVTSRAVATLDEARNELAGYCPVPEHPGRALAHDDPACVVLDQIKALTEFGGTVGLPDGTVIEVIPTPLTRIFSELRHSMALPADAATEAGIIDAYNAAQRRDA